MLDDGRLNKELDLMLTAVWDGNDAAAHALVDRMIELFYEGWYFCVPDVRIGMAVPATLLVYRNEEQHVWCRLHVIDATLDAPNFEAFAATAPEWIRDALHRVRQQTSIGMLVYNAASLERIEILP